MGWDVKIWSTEALYNYWYGDARNAAEQYVRRTLEETDYSITSIQVMPEAPSPPNEDVLSWSDEGPGDVCSTYDHSPYDAFTNWWLDWLKCNYDSSTWAEDANILLTNYHGGDGVTAGSCPVTDENDPLKCIVEADDIGYLYNKDWDVGRPYEENGYTYKQYEQMFAGVIHELGHAANKAESGTGTCYGDSSTYDEEAMGNFFPDQNTTWYKHDGTSVNEDLDILTPMVTPPWYYGDYNDCCYYLGSDTAHYEGYRRRWSNCILDHAKPCGAW